MKKRCIIAIILVFALLLCIVPGMLFPLTYGGADPAEHFQRYYDGGNCCISLLDAAAHAVSKDSAIFDVTKNGEDGVLSCHLDLKKNRAEAFLQTGTGNNVTAQYILITNGILYSFSMNADGWFFDNSRVCTTDFQRLCKNFARILTNKNVNEQDLKTDLNGLVGVDLSEYLNFKVLPTVIRSLVTINEDESFRLVSGYEFTRNNFELCYSFSPKDNRAVAEKINSAASLAYTKKISNIMNIAGIAGGIADLIGIDLFSFLNAADVSFSTDYFSGKLLSFGYETEKTEFSATLRKYGSGPVQIKSAQLEALLLKHVEKSP